MFLKIWQTSQENKQYSTGGYQDSSFFYQDILHKNKTLKYLNTPKTHNKAHSLGKKCPDKIADKKNNQ